MRIAVTGRLGQIARSLREQASENHLEIVTLARPDFDLAHPETIEASISALEPDAVINAAAYTAVDQAENEPELAYLVNATGAGAVSRATSKLNIPIIHISTDYVFDGRLARPYVEMDVPAPLGIYGSSKLEGEQLVAASNANHVIIRTSWVYSPFGKNFVKTMLSLAWKQNQVAVVKDQNGSPTSALDIADGLLRVTRNLLDRPRDDALRGIFHLTALERTNWAEFAEEIFRISSKLGGPSAHVNAIPSSAYPTLAKRPWNSQMDPTKLAAIHGVRLRTWPTSLKTCIVRILAEGI